MNTIVTLDAAVLQARARVDEWERKWKERWYAPVILQEQTMAFLQAGPDEQQGLAESDPQLHAKIVANVRQLARRLQGIEPRPVEGEPYAPST